MQATNNFPMFLGCGHAPVFKLRVVVLEHRAGEIEPKASFGRGP
jgi:hypothetical protein